MTHDPRSRVDNDVRGAERLARVVAAHYHELRRMRVGAEDAVYLTAAFQESIIERNKTE